MMTWSKGLVGDFYDLVVQKHVQRFNNSALKKGVIILIVTEGVIICLCQLNILYKLFTNIETFVSLLSTHASY